MLDWERGELTGVPGWDWFHYVLQSGMLVERWPTARLVKAAEELLSQEAFQKYSRAAGIAGVERDLMLAYLMNCIEVIQPAEGLPETVDLLKALTAKWRQ